MNTIKHLIDLDLMPMSQLLEIIDMAGRIAAHPDHYTEACRGKMLATLFYEPSTRTKMSFAAAMQRLGGTVIGFDNPSASSVAKGETLYDTVKVVSGYSDIVVIRHQKDGAALAAAKASLVPVINAGDGVHLHPTQTLADLVTMHNECKRLDNLHIGLCGDLKNGRTVHSLVKTMLRFKNNKFTLISHPDFKMPDHLKNEILQKGAEFKEVTNLKEVIGELDFLYMTRMQKERDSSAGLSANILDKETLALGKPTLRVGHPLPRVDEIAAEVDEDPRCVYFKQTRYGMYARMALILNILEKDFKMNCVNNTVTLKDKHCCNSNCITNFETYLPHTFRKQGEQFVCEYCDTPNN